MKASLVPQDNISTYASNRKVIYAVDEGGHYGLVTSSGWAVEEEATRQALNEFERQANEARAAVLAGTASPLFYHMSAQRMDLQVLSESTGIFKWRIRRHFRPKIFRRLAAKMLARYAEALGMSIADLKALPPQESPHG